MAGLNKFKSNMELYLVPAGDDYVADDNHQWFDKEEFMEDCIIRKWKTLPLSEKYNIVRRQYPTDTGKIDILAISKDKKELLVIELKKREIQRCRCGAGATLYGLYYRQSCKKWAKSKRSNYRKRYGQADSAGVSGCAKHSVLLLWN